MVSPSSPQASRPAEVCPGCGAQLLFNPTAGLLSCPYCQTTAPLAASQTPVLERNLEQWLHGSPAALTTLSKQAQEVDCPGCRAQITFEPPEVAGNCPFCKTHITTQPHAASPVITPEGILPFKVDQKTARQYLSRWLKNRWFAPGELKHLAQHEGIQGVYLPFWTFDCHTKTQYTGERGTHYSVTKTRRVKNDQGEWVNETYKDEETRWQSVSGQIQQSFDDLLIPAVKSVKSAHLEQLAPWSLIELAAYNSKFLAGFRVQRYQVNLKQGFELAQREMKTEITSSIRRDIGGDEQRVCSQSTTYHDKSFKHVLLPVWMATYRYRNQPYQVLINGETGKVVGDHPYSAVKITLAVIAAAIAVMAFLGIRTASDRPVEPPQPPNSQPSATY